MRSLRSVCNEIGVSRTTLQGWLYDILDKKSQGKGVNKDIIISNDELLKIWQIRFYKQLKYSNTKIKQILNDSEFDLPSSLDNEIKELTKQKEELERLIKVATLIKETGITPSSTRNLFSNDNDNNINYNSILNLFGTILDNHNLVSHFKDPFENITSHDSQILENCLYKLAEYKNNNVDCNSDKTQDEVKIMHKLLSKYSSESIIALGSALMFIAPGSGLAIELDQVFNTNISEYICQSILTYCKNNKNNDFDKDFHISIDKLCSFASKNVPYTSIKVQSTIDRLYRFIVKINFAYGDEVCLDILNNFKNFFKSESNSTDAERKTNKYITDALDFYINNF